MEMKRIAVLVSGGGTNLQALIDAQVRGEIPGGQITAVISSKEGAYALERAAKAQIPGYVLPRKDFDSNQAMTSLFEQTLLLYGDAVAAVIIDAKGLDIHALWDTHANLE